jgi:radical SAM superfamily enzyme YgiQ (UPF0313 family)
MSAKVLIVLPPATLRGHRVTPTHHPIVAAYLAASAEQSGADVQVVDAALDGLSPEEVGRRAVRADADVVGIVPFEYRRELPLDTSLAVAAEVRRQQPRARIGLLNGAELEHVAAVRGAVENGAVDFAATGDSEASFAELLRGGEYEAPPPGVLRRNRSGDVRDGGKREADDLDRLPFPAWHHFEHRRYFVTPHRYERLPVLPVMASRACPYACDFCPQAMFNTTQKHRVRSADGVVAEILELHGRFGARHIEFYDASFGTKRAVAARICEKLVEAGRPVSWSCFTRADLLDRDLLPLMAASGCRTILLGVESGSQALVEATGKGLDLDAVRAGVELCRRAGIDTIVSFIIGLPGETPQTIEQTIRFATELAPTYAQFHLCRTYFDLPRWREAGRVETGWKIGSESFKGHAYVPRAFASSRELQAWQRTAYRRFYLRPSSLLRLARVIGNAEDLARIASGGAMLMRQLFTERTNLTVES